MSECPRCLHSASKHYPRHNRGTTACVTCLDHGYHTFDSESSSQGLGICCWQSPDIDRHAEETYCGRWGCNLPKGHNMGKLDVPENHSIEDPDHE